MSKLIPTNWMNSTKGKKSNQSIDLLRNETETSFSIWKIKAEIKSYDQIKDEYYKRYDVNVGLRTAAILAGFFGFLLFLLFYKTRCKVVKERFFKGDNFSIPDDPFSKGTDIFKDTSSVDKKFSFQDDIEESGDNITSLMLSRYLNNVANYDAFFKSNQFCSPPTSNGSRRNSYQMIITSVDLSSDFSRRNSYQLRVPKARIHSQSSASDASSRRASFIDACASRRSRKGYTRCSIRSNHSRDPTDCLPIPLRTDPLLSKAEATEKWVNEIHPVNINVIQPTPETSPRGSIVLDLPRQVGANFLQVPIDMDSPLPARRSGQQYIPRSDSEEGSDLSVFLSVTS